MPHQQRETNVVPLPTPNKQAGLTCTRTPERQGHETISSDPAANRGVLARHDETSAGDRGNMRLERRWQGREGEREEGRKRNTLLARISLPRGELSMVSLKLWVARGDVLRLALLEMGARKINFLGVPLLCIPSN